MTVSKMIENTVPISSLKYFRGIERYASTQNLLRFKINLDQGLLEDVYVVVLCNVHNFNLMRQRNSSNATFKYLSNIAHLLIPLKTNRTFHTCCFL